MREQCRLINEKRGHFRRMFRESKMQENINYMMQEQQTTNMKTNHYGSFELYPHNTNITSISTNKITSPHSRTIIPTQVTNTDQQQTLTLTDHQFIPITTSEAKSVKNKLSVHQSGFNLNDHVHNQSVNLQVTLKNPVAKRKRIKSALIAKQENTNHPYKKSHKFLNSSNRPGSPGTLKEYIQTFYDQNPSFDPKVRNRH